jgi:hypothetical protein
MRFVPLFAFAAVLAACAPTVTDACDAYAQAFCSRNLACLTGNDLSNFQAQYGSTLDVCMTSYENANHCNAGQAPCPVGLSYDTNQVEQCASDYQNSSCLDVSQPGFQPASCTPDKVCHN